MTDEGIYLQTCCFASVVSKIDIDIWNIVYYLEFGKTYICTLT